MTALGPITNVRFQGVRDRRLSTLGGPIVSLLRGRNARPADRYFELFGKLGTPSAGGWHVRCKVSLKAFQPVPS